MGLLGIFDIGKSALFASQAALSVASNNIANINTPGYSRQDIVLNIATPGMTGAGAVGRGVTVDGIKRSYDGFIQAQLLGESQNQSRSAAMDNAWGQIEQVFNEAQGVGLGSSLTDYFNAWNDVATNPTSSSQRIVLLQKASSLTAAAKVMESSVVDTLKNANLDIKDGVQQVNTLASDIAKLNDQIVQQESGSAANSANDLRDQRDQKLTELSKLVDASTYEDNTGAVTVTVGMRTLVSGTRTNALSAVPDSEGNRNLYLDGINITANLQKGQIGGLLAARNDIQSSALPALRRLAASITQQVNALHSAGYGLDGTTGNNFFIPLQLTTTGNSSAATIAGTITSQTALTLDEYKIAFDAGGSYTVTNKQSGATVIPATPYVSGSTIALPGMNVVVTGAVTAADSFTVSPLTTAVSNFTVAVTDPQSIAASSSAAELPGNNANALQIAQLADAAQSTVSNTTFSSYYGGIVSTVGTMKQTASDNLTFDNNLLSSLQKRRDTISGVSLDEEAANLISYQRSYQAGARLISVADQLLQTVLQLGL